MSIGFLETVVNNWGFFAAIFAMAALIAEMRHKISSQDRRLTRLEDEVRADIHALRDVIDRNHAAIMDHLLRGH